MRLFSSDIDKVIIESIEKVYTSRGSISYILGPDTVYGATSYQLVFNDGYCISIYDHSGGYFFKVVDDYFRTYNRNAKINKIIE